jgi:hypothetical protein
MHNVDDEWYNNERLGMFGFLRNWLSRKNLCNDMRKNLSGEYMPKDDARFHLDYGKDHQHSKTTAFFLR